jgi:hypothetical protein
MVFSLLIAGASCAGPRVDEEAKYGVPSPYEAGEGPIVILRECIPYVEPKPGDAAAGFSLLATEGGGGVSDYWILVRQRGFDRSN